MTYIEIINSKGLKSHEEAITLFKEEIALLWDDEYSAQFPKHGEIYLQTFEGYNFLIDVIWPSVQNQNDADEYPESRVIGFWGLSNKNVKPENRLRVRGWWGQDK